MGAASQPFRDKDSDAYRKLDELPGRLCREVEREVRGGGTATVQLARQWQTAVLIGIELMIPLRLKNLAELHLGADLIRHPDRRLFISLWENQTKNKEPLDVEVEGPLAEMLRQYIDRYRPALDPGGSAWLFPGRTPDRPKSHDAIREQITSTLAKRCGSRWHPHLFRHFAALRILQHMPDAYGLAQRVLGHKSLDTLMRYYSGVETAEALAHFQRIVLGYQPSRRSAPRHTTSGGRHAR